MDTEPVEEATQRLLRTVETLTDADRTAPSTLPGWSRGHVLAHLVLNAEGLAAVAAGLRHGANLPFYRSDAGRDADIEALSTADAGELGDRLRASATRWSAEVAALPAALADRAVERTPGGPTFTAGEIPQMRLREVEIHHADLGLGPGPSGWPAAFVADVLTLLAHDRGAVHDLLLRTPDGDLPVGAGTGPVIEGPAHLIAWWLLGRGAGEGLTGPAGGLPELGPWSRRPVSGGR